MATVWLDSDDDDDNRDGDDVIDDDDDDDDNHDDDNHDNDNHDDDNHDDGTTMIVVNMSMTAVCALMLTNASCFLLLFREND